MEKDVYTALGLMSGTSLDGVDVAVIETDGVDIFGFGTVTGWPYDGEEYTALKAAVASAVAWAGNGPPPNSVMGATSIVDNCHIDAVFRLIGDTGQTKFDVIGYHGQTVFHRAAVAGRKGFTLQLGDGERLATEINAPCVYDFRSADVAAGGQGAPLAPIYHEALVRHAKLEGRIAVLNLGGVANVTAIIDGKLSWATDCGPANGPLDSWIQAHNVGNYDRDGQYAFAGLADHARVDRWLKRDFFRRPIPRSADRYDFDVLSEMQGLSLKDGAATLASFCAQSVARDLREFSADKVIICGGGRLNPAIMAMLDMHIDAEIVSADQMGWDGESLEAQAFAYLAVRTLKGLPISFPETTGAPRPLTGGKVAYPSNNLGSRGGE